MLGGAPGGPPGTDQASLEATLAALGPEFTVSETQHFVILSDGPIEWSRATGTLLEATHDRFDRFMRRLGIPAAPPADRLQCVLIRDHARFEAFARGQDGVDAGWMAGYYATHTNRVVFYDTETSPDFVRARERVDDLAAQEKRAAELARGARRERGGETADAYKVIAARAREEKHRQQRLLEERASQAGIAKTTHEAAHLLAFNRGLQLRSRQYPFWLSEGLATCFECQSVDAARKGKFGPEEENPIRAREFAEASRRGELVPLEALVEMNAASPDEDIARVLYAQAHALFRWLYRYEREALAGLFADIAREAAGTISARRQGEMFRARFGDPAKLERRFLRETAPPAVPVAASPDEP